MGLKHGGIKMKNDIAKLIEAYSDLWNDINSLIRDIEYLILNKYKWTHYENKKVGKRCYYTSFYNGNNLLYIFYDLSVDIPYLQVSLFHISDDEDENDEEVGLGYLEENWKGIDPSFYLYDKNYEIDNTENGFKVIIEGREKYIFSPCIDFMSITSSEVVNEDINILINSLITGTYEEYKAAYLSYVEYSEKINSHSDLVIDDENYHYVLRQYGIEGAINMAKKMCEKQGIEITEINIYSNLSNLESDLEHMFSGGEDDPQ
jgi:hypothetical protein